MSSLNAKQLSAIADNLQSTAVTLIECIDEKLFHAALQGKFHSEISVFNTTLIAPTKEYYKNLGFTILEYEDITDTFCISWKESK